MCIKTQERILTLTVIITVMLLQIASENIGTISMFRANIINIYDDYSLIEK